MIGNDKIWFLRGGLFAKYVVSLVGLVVFVLAVNGAMETWISYRATRTTLTDAMSEKADATARRIEQSVSELERQISWVTRASVVTIEQRRADYAQLLNQVPAVGQIFWLNGNGREQLRLTRTTVSVSSGADFSRDIRFTETVARGVSFAPAYFKEQRPFMSISVAHSGFNAGATVAEVDLGFLGDFLGDAQVGRLAYAYVVDQRGQVLASSARGPEVAKDLSKLPQVAALIAPATRELASGNDAAGQAVLTASTAVPKLGWFVLFEQPTAQALAPIRDQLVRIALLIGLGLLVAILAGTLMARRMLIPITALRAGARRLGAGDFSHRIDVHTKDELEELADQFNSMAGQLHETYSGLETKVEERTRDLAQSVNELKVLEEVGRADAADHPLRDVAIAAGFHSVLVVPLVDQKGILGSLVVLRNSAGEFSENLIGLMRTFAHQSVLAMRNARLFTEVDQKGRELATAHSTVQQQADQLLNWNKSLEERVEKQLGEIERIRKLERFLAPQVAQLIASSDGHDSLLDSHRREVTVVFCDLRGFTAFTEATEPEEAMNVLREYHAALGELIFRYEGTLDRYAGDGVMILFNAPIQFADHTQRAVKMAVEMRDAIGALTQKWRNRGHSLGFGVGIALGYATLGQIGFEQRLEYAAIGSVTNLASRLCDEAKANQIVVSRRVFGMVEPWVEGKPLDDLNLKGFNHPVLAVEILRWREEGEKVAEAAAEAPRRRQQ